MNVMKTTVRVMTAALIAVSMQAAAARKGGSARTVDAQKPADSVVIYRTDTVYINNVADEDGNVSELAQITNQWQLEAYKAKLREESNATVESESDRQRKSIENGVYEQRQIFKLFGSYFTLVLMGVGLPCLVLFLYLHYSKKRQQRYEMLIDLIRSGVEMKPEILDALSLSMIKINWRMLAPQKNTGMAVERKGMAAEHYVYCLKRIAWAVFCVAFGTVLAAMSNEGVMFGLGVAVALVLLLQAAIRYFGLSYVMKSTDVRDMGNTNIVNNNQTSTPDNNAQQP
ncbi:MAG: hypothetical protein J6C05_00050 [Prevotella sp.]|nr:hypothetical protein [Prevotella sp.]